MAAPSEREVRDTIRRAYAQHLHRRAMTHEVQQYFEIVSRGQESLQAVVNIIATSEEAAAARERITRNYTDWISRYDTLADDDRKAIAGHIASFDKRPVVSINLTVGGVEADSVEATLQSIGDQLYREWELCIATSSDLPEHIAAVLADAQASDRRVKVIAEPGTNSNIRARARARETSTGDYLAFVHEGDLLAPTALYEIVHALQAVDADVVYSDHDFITDLDVRHSPVFKTDWNLELFLAWNYIGDLTVFRRELLDRAGHYAGGPRDLAEHDLAARAIARTSDDKVHHVPSILYHRRASENAPHFGGMARCNHALLPQPALDHLLASRGRTRVATRRERLDGGTQAHGLQVGIFTNEPDLIEDRFKALEVSDVPVLINRGLRWTVVRLRLGHLP